MTPRPLHGGGLAAWSIRHPVGVVMIALALVVLGGNSLQRLAVDLLPHLIYPEVRVRVLDPGVPAAVMEDRVTRQLEEQLAITEDAISVQSRTTEGRSAVDLSFAYGKDIDLALRDASTRLDRARRFLPDTIDPPIIYKRDPAQIPVLELVVSSHQRDSMALRDWTDYVFAKWFVNLPGVAAAEVGGGLLREIQVLPDTLRLAALGLTLDDVAEALQRGNVETPGGRLHMARGEMPTRTAARFQRLDEIAGLPIALPGRPGEFARLGELAEIRDGHEDERLRVRLNGQAGLKVSIQKQPGANTVQVVDAVNARLDWLRDQGLIPPDIRLDTVGDQAVYVRHALSNTARAALYGALLAMAVVYLFLGDIRRTLVIGSVIPIAIAVTLTLMDLGGLSLNIMTLGGLAVGVGMLVDNTIVMLENIQRHQRQGETALTAGTHAAAEVNSAIVASTSTNLAAILPFLFVSGLTGLLFRELIFTVSAAVFASLVVALTLVPALAVRVPPPRPSGLRSVFDAGFERLQHDYARGLRGLLQRSWPWMLLLFGAALAWALHALALERQDFLPRMDDGRVFVRVTADPGVNLETMDADVRQIETLLREQPEVRHVFSIVGGRIFGRSQYESSNSSSLIVQLLPRAQRRLSVDAWIQRMRALQAERLPMAGIKLRLFALGVRGIRTGRGDDDVGIRVAGPELETLDAIGRDIAARLEGLPGLRNLAHSSEETRQELAVRLDRDRAASLGIDASDVGEVIRYALEGRVVSDYMEGDRAYAIRVRLPRPTLDGVDDLEDLVLARRGQGVVRLRDVARVELITVPLQILRDNQQRMVEVSASLSGERSQDEVLHDIQQRLAGLDLPEGYTLYDAGLKETLQQGRATLEHLLGLALFLVFVVMAVQYESLRNPLVIMLSVPFTLIGVAAGLTWLELPLSMPVWLGMIMLTGIVVNNAIVLVEYIEILRAEGRDVHQAIIEAARLRLRPILMTSLTTVIGLLPLCLGLGEGAEMLQPLAVTLVFGLTFAMLVSLLLVPVTYRLLAAGPGRPEDHTG